MAQDTASQATRRPAEPAWMGSLRAAARARFDAMKWPALSEEEWRRTDVSRLALDSFQPALPAKPACPRDAEVGAQAALIRFEGTRCLEMGVSAEASAKGVRIMPLDLALEEFETTLHAAMDEAIARADNRFLAWHYASLSHGALLWVPGGVELADPIVIDMKELGGSGPTATMPHLQVVAGEGARAGIILRISGGGSGTLCNAAVDLRLAEGARVSFHEAQELDAGSLSFSHTHARVGKDATLTHCSAQFGGRMVKARVETDLAGTGAHAELNGLYYGRKGQHVDLRTVQNHSSPKATSRAYYKGAVAGGGRTVFQGLIEVAPGASGTDAFLTNRNLVLGEAARSDSIPTLRIGNNDVKCSHGSTTGRLNADQVFYLESRGLSATDAREMLVVGYFEDLLGAEAPESFREDALSVIRARLRDAA